MIIRLSAKLSKKILVRPDKSVPADPNPFTDWSTHRFTADRVQYILVTNTPSLYSMVMYGRGINDAERFLDGIICCMREFFNDDGLEFTFARHIAPSTGDIIFSKSLNRAVVGSMNDLVHLAKTIMTQREVSPRDTSLFLNDLPMSYLNYDNPREAFLKLKPGADRVS